MGQMPSPDGLCCGQGQGCAKGDRSLGATWVEPGVVAPEGKTGPLEPAEPCPGPSLEITSLKI